MDNYSLDVALIRYLSQVFVALLMVEAGFLRRGYLSLIGLLLKHLQPP